MDDSKTKRVVCDVPLETANLFLTQANLAGTDSQQLIREWIIEYVGNPKPAPEALPKDHQRWVDKLLYVLRSGDRGCIQAVTSNLVQFERVVRLAGEEKKRKSS